MEAIGELAAAGLIVRSAGRHVFRLVPHLEDAAEALASVDFSSTATRARWAEHMGDHLEPLEAVLSPAELVDACTKVIDGPVSAAAGTAIERLNAHLDYPFCAAVPRLLERADPTTDNPYSVYEGARYLLRRDVATPLARRVALAFANVEVVPGFGGNPYLAELALLLLEHWPSEALPVVRRALGSNTPLVRQRSAAALAVLDQPWCHREMLLALDDAATFEESEILRQALLRSGAPGARVAVEAWVRAHVQRVEPGPGYSWEEVLEANAAEWLAHGLDELRPWAESVRARIDPDFDRAVWA